MAVSRRPQWYELAHDRLLQAIDDSNRAWFSTHERGTADDEAAPNDGPGDQAVVQALQRQNKSLVRLVVLLATLLVGALTVIFLAR